MSIKRTKSIVICILSYHNFIDCSYWRFRSSVFFIYFSDFPLKVFCDVLIWKMIVFSIFSFLPYRNNRPPAIWMIGRKVVASFVNIYYFPVVLGTDWATVPTFFYSKFACSEFQGSVDYSCIVSSRCFCSDEHFCIGVRISFPSTSISELEPFFLKKSN